MVVVWTLGFVVVVYISTLAACAVLKIQPPQDVLAALKDVGLVALGGLTGLLARTSSEEQPVRAEITNSPANPIPTHDTPTPPPDMGRVEASPAPDKTP